MLGKILQTDFSGGAYPNVAAERVPSNGLSDAINALISDDGLLYRRGGSTYETDATAGPDPLRAVWHGRLAAGERLVSMSASNLVAYSGATPVDVYSFGSVGGLDLGHKPVFLAGLIIVDSIAYGGGLDGSIEDTGTVTVTNGDTEVVGAGTTWNTDIVAGELFEDFRAGGGVYVIADVVDDTHLILAQPMRGATGAGLNYLVYALQAVTRPSGAMQFCFVAGNKLMVCDGNRMYESAVNDPFFHLENEYLDFPEGANLLGGEYLRDQAIVFSSAGVFVVSGVAYDLTDADGNPQQRVELTNRELILWSWAGVATWENRLIVPALDGIYLFDGISEPVNISQGILELYRSYVEAGYLTGVAAVENGHYVLPIVNPSGDVVVDQLICRLRPTRRGREGTAFGWTRGDDYGGSAVGLAVMVTAADGPVLLGAHGDGRISRLKFFEVTASSPLDADGTAYVAEIVTREFPAGGLVVALVRRLLARFELVDPAATNPTLTLAYSIDGAAWVTHGTTAGERDLTAESFPWSVNKKAHGVRFRIRTANSVARFILHALEVAIRPSGRAVK